MSTSQTSTGTIEIVSASAGSGKTHTLTHDLAARIAAGAAPEGCMAITFTNLAADEIASRIRRTLLDEGKWETAQRVLDGYLGTVHSVCGAIIGEFAFEAGFSPELDVVPAEESRLLFNRAIATITADPAIAGRIEGPARRMGIDDWREPVRTIVERARENALTPDDVRASAARSWSSMSALFEPFGEAADGDALDRRFIGAVGDALAALADADDTTKKTETVREALASIMRAARDGGGVRWSDWVRASKLDPAVKSRELVAPVIEVAGEHVRHAGLRQDLRELIDAVFECAARSMEAFARYKAESGLIDFADQESQALALLGRDDVRAALSERLDTLFVDEFQDTSPIQLALLLRLASCARRTVWIGDQKQSIYAFRGADPSLMDAAIRAIAPEADAASLRILETSYRSRPELVTLANELFAAAFAVQRIPRNRVVLEAKRKPEPAQAPAVAQWRFASKNVETDRAAIAGGIADMLERSDEHLVLDRVSGALRPVRGGDIAVLCRTHAACDGIATALANLGVRVSIGRPGLLATPECVLALAALRYLVDRRDTLAAAELVHYHVAEGEQRNGHDGAWLDAWIESRRTDAGLPPHVVLARIDAERERLLHLTPSETLEVAIAVAGVEEQVARWGDAAARLANIDALRGLARRYEDRCLSRRSGSTAAGLVTFLSREAARDAELDRQPESSDPDAVVLRTYHASKGLEWPVVVMGELDTWKEGSPFGVGVEPMRAEIDMSDPLAGRWIRYWPWPFERQEKGAGINDTAAVTTEGAREMRRRAEENVRLLYVGVTRARDYLVLPLRSGATAKWLDRLEDEHEVPIITIADDPEEPLIEVAGKWILAAYRFVEPRDAVSSGDATSIVIAPPAPDDPPSYPPLRLQPSAAAGELAAGLELLAEWSRLPLVGAAEMSAVGEAVHRFLAIDDPARARDARESDASRILGAWGVTALGAAQLIEASDRLHGFIAGRWPGATLRREWPVAARVGDQRMAGRLDLLVEHGATRVVIDYKTFPGDWRERVPAYAGQLAAYRAAVGAGEAMVYLPVAGVMVAVQSH